MAQLGPNTQGEDRQRLRAVNDFSHIPAPAEATWVGEWDHLEGRCGHAYWARGSQVAVGRSKRASLSR
jgi:hypothetical protein